MGEFNTLIKELEAADRRIKDMAEENKRLQLELNYHQNCIEDFKKFKYETEQEMNLLKKESVFYMQKLFKLEDDLEEFLGGGKSVKG